MNWGDLTAFRAVVEELSFTRAAARLRIAQPALSVRIRRLERELGTRLLERTTRSTRVTPQGRALADWVDETARSWDQVRAEVSGVVAARAPGHADTINNCPRINARRVS
ncbi:LysR family transcriptional regulator [Micromonospora endolithica]|uniref:LysR family transcriptional regulator n=1 Tax=Micromonospora endolithica TaxID=230091 RepID=A0A3A9ZHV7_9ACTN|nr:LysR family transcriptional regulator [Micromonospora endolithica]TWJ21606.1 regulatory helix-turn-helix LysR family protein [Micromonospora endolithica]